VIILSIRTDKPESEIAIFDDHKKIDKIIWQAHRSLADTIHIKIKELLDASGKGWGDIQGLVCFKGPGSFTGLRIGLTVANTIAYSNNAQIVSCNGEDWQEQGVIRLLKGENEKIALPFYGREAKITKPKK
jgi:tRNA threonylcarbamoyladenosine biosynthesis protein TsaB